MRIKTIQRLDSIERDAKALGLNLGALGTLHKSESPDGHEWHSDTFAVRIIGGTTSTPRQFYADLKKIEKYVTEEIKRLEDEVDCCDDCSYGYLGQDAVAEETARHAYLDKRRKELS